MVWCDQLILLFVRTRLDWLFWQNDAGGWYHNRVGINLRYYLSNRLIRNWWQNTIQKWIWKGVSLTYFHSIYWTSAENVYFILDISITSPRTENPLAAEISLRVGDRFNQDVSHHLEGLTSFQFQNSKFQSNIEIVIAQPMNCAGANLVPCRGSVCTSLRRIHTLSMDTRADRGFPALCQKVQLRGNWQREYHEGTWEGNLGGSGWDQTNDCKSFRLKHTHIQDSSSSVEISAAAVLGKL